MEEAAFRAKLEERGAMIARDVTGDFPELDASYECYVVYPQGSQVGFIYMGECGEWAFVAEEGELVDAPDLVGAAKALSPYRKW